MADTSEICQDAEAARRDQGDYEVEFSDGYEGDSQKAFASCKKNPKHTDFIPIHLFNMAALPVEYQTDLVFDMISLLSELCVRLTTSYVSLDRPRGYPGFRRRGTNFQMFGSGWINSVDRLYKSEDKKLCPCVKCTESGSPVMEWGKILVHTARHVVFDSSEAKATTCELFFRDKTSNQRNADGRKTQSDPSDHKDMSGQAQTDEAGQLDGTVGGSIGHSFDKTQSITRNADNSHQHRLEQSGNEGALQRESLCRDTDKDREQLPSMAKTGDKDGATCNVEADKVMGNDDFKTKEGNKKECNFSNSTNCKTIDEMTAIKDVVEDVTMPATTSKAPQEENNKSHISPRDSDKPTCHTTVDATAPNLAGNDGNDSQILYGHGADGNDTANDLSEFHCYTHDIALCQRIQTLKDKLTDLQKKIWDRYGPSRDEDRLTVLVSHPHGCGKHVTIGHWSNRERIGPFFTKFSYDTPTCPGSSGAPVCILGRRLWHTIHPHSGQAGAGGLNMSSVRVDPQPTNM